MVYAVSTPQPIADNENIPTNDCWINHPYRRFIMWTKPAATEMRFGFEVTMYVCNR